MALEDLALRKKFRSGKEWEFPSVRQLLIFEVCVSVSWPLMKMACLPPFSPSFDRVMSLTAKPLVNRVLLLVVYCVSPSRKKGGL